MNEFTIPERCITCPHIAEGLLHIEEHVDELEHLNMHAKEDVPTEIADSIIETLSRLEDIPVDDEHTEELRKRVRMSLGQRMNEVDTLIAEHRLSLVAATIGCRGLFKVRASRDGITYTVGICGSPNTANGNSIEPANIHRTNQK